MSSRNERVDGVWASVLSFFRFVPSCTVKQRQRLSNTQGQMNQLAKLISVAVAATVQQQQAAAGANAAPPAATGTATATTSSPNDGPRLKVTLRKFSGKEADWDEWHKVYSSQARILGFAKELVETDEIRVGADNFNSQGVNPLRAKRASEAWLFLITTCKDTALEMLQSTDSPSAAWRELLQRYHARGLKDKNRLIRVFNSLKMELGEGPKNSLREGIASPVSCDKLGKPSMRTTRTWRS